MDSYRNFHAGTHLQTPISSLRPPNASNFVKIPKIEHGVADIFRTLFSKTPLIKIIRPNLWAKNDRMVILSLSTFRGKLRFDCILPIDIPLFRGKPLFHFKPSGIYFEWFCSPLNVFLSYYYFLFLAPWPWLPSCSAKLLKTPPRLPQSLPLASLGGLSRGM